MQPTCRRHGETARDLRFRRSRAVLCSPGWTRTNNPPVNSRMLCQLSYRGSCGDTVASRRSQHSNRIPTPRQARPSSSAAARSPASAEPADLRVSRVQAGIELVGPGASRPDPLGGRRAITVSPSRPRTTTRRCSTTLAVTRSRSNVQQRPGLVDRELVDRLGVARIRRTSDPAAGRRRGTSRRTRPAPRGCGSRHRAAGPARPAAPARALPGAEQPGAVLGAAGRPAPVSPRASPARTSTSGGHRGPRRAEPPHSPPIAFSRSVRRCCSRATSSPNIRL